MSTEVNPIEEPGEVDGETTIHTPVIAISPFDDDSLEPPIMAESAAWPPSPSKDLLDSLRGCMGEGDECNLRGVMSALWVWKNHWKVGFNSRFLPTRIPKGKDSTGKMKWRLIHQPEPVVCGRLARVLLKRISSYVETKMPSFQYDLSTGFRPGKSVKDAVIPHIKRPIVISVDLKDFFHTVRLGQLRDTFKKVEKQLTPLFTSEMDFEEAVDLILDSFTYPIPDYPGENRLPMGSPLSPYFANLAATDMDKSMARAIGKINGGVYTRYADDLTFSFNNWADGTVGKVLKTVRGIVQDAGFIVNDKKIEIMPAKKQQRVLGVVVNGDRPTIDKRLIDGFRLLLRNTANEPRRAMDSYRKTRFGFGPSGEAYLKHNLKWFHGFLRGRMLWYNTIDPVRTSSRLSESFTGALLSIEDLLGEVT